MTGTIILWFRRDLRLEDHPALSWAIQQKRPIVPLFIWAPDEEKPWAPGAASRWWLHHSLQSLSSKINDAGGRLIIRRGSSLPHLQTLIRECQASTVVWSRLYEPALVARDEAIKKSLMSAGVETLSFNSQLLLEPWEIQSQSKSPFKVFTPFFKAAVKKMADSPLPRFSSYRDLCETFRASAPFSGQLDSLSLDSLSLLPTRPWDKTMRDTWTPGEESARKSFSLFLKDRLSDYATQREIPRLVGTSRLSPHLHFGEISPLHLVERLQREIPDFLRSPSGETFYREIFWREFAHHILFHFPRSAEAPLNTQFENFPWIHSPSQFRKWSSGQSGFPIVDAGLRELWATGWMHNRVRMIVASFLTKDLRISWLEGARWFWDTLVDANLASNSLGWQWAGGCGADAAPYFRIFNPLLQSQKFDPEGIYIKKWIPELRDSDSVSVHEPWAEKIARAGARSLRYPKPMLNHKAAREAALKAFKSMRL